MCIATRCTSVEQFVQMFHRFVDEESFFVSTLNTRPAGLETPFSVQLVDGTPVLRGLCVVLQAWTDSANPFKTPGVRLGIKRLTANSMLVFEQLLVTRSGKPPPGMKAPATQPGSGIPPLAAAALAAGSTKLPSVIPPIPKLASPATAAPTPAAKSPFTETAPTKLALSRLGPVQPVKPPSSAPQTQPLGSRTTSAVPRLPPMPPGATANAAPDVSPRTATPTEPQPPVPSRTATPTMPQPPVPSRTATPTDPQPPAPSRTATPTVPQPPVSTAEADRDAVPDEVPQEPTDVIEEKTDVRETKLPRAASPPIEGTRTPGSDLILPANPLMNLSDESLMGYVDCTLYEETGNFFPAEEDAAGFVDDVAPPPVLAPRPAVTPSLLASERPPSTGFETDPGTELGAKRFETAHDAPAPASAAAVESASAAGVETASPAIVVPPVPLPPPTPRDSVMVDPALVARGSAPVVGDEPAADPVHAPLFASATPARDLDAASPVLVPRSAARVPLHKRRQVWLVGGAGAVALVLLIVVFSASSSDGSPPAAAPKAPASKSVAKLATHDDVAAGSSTGTPEVATQPAGDEPSGDDPTDEPTDDAPEPDEPPAGDGPPLVGSGPCRVVVLTTPAGSTIKLDGNSVGPSPLTIATSCERHKLDVSHARYQAISRFVSLAAGKPQNLEVTLSRPTHVVTVTSQPSGATIFLDGRRAGTTPMKLSVLGFVTVKLDFKKTGYQPTGTKLYSKRANDKVAVQLRRW